MNNTQRGIIIYGLLGIAFICHTVFIEWRSSNFSEYKNLPIVSLYSYTKVRVEERRDRYTGSSYNEYFNDEYIFGIYKDQNVGTTTTVIIGLVVPFLCLIAALYIYFGTSKENRIKLLEPIITLPSKIKSSVRSFIQDKW